jgi:hypothetical protein
VNWFQLAPVRSTILRLGKPREAPTAEGCRAEAAQMRRPSAETLPQVLACEFGDESVATRFERDLKSGSGRACAKRHVE